MNYTSILSTILKGLVNGIISKSGSEAFGWLLTLVGDKQPNDFSEILAQLQTLQTDMDQIQNDIDAILTELEAILVAVEWNALMGQLYEPITFIEGQFQLLQQLDDTDVASAESLTSWGLQNAAVYLADINNAILPDPAGINPGQAGLIEMLGAAVAQASLKDPSYNHSWVNPASPLNTYYAKIEQYFLYLVQLQIKCLTLLANAYNYSGETNLATIAIQTFQANLRLQGQAFLSAVEAFTVNYACDMSLMSIFGRTEAFDSLHQAGLTIDAICGTTNLLRQALDRLRPFRQWPVSSVLDHRHGICPAVQQHHHLGWNGQLPHAFLYIDQNKYRGRPIPTQRLLRVYAVPVAVELSMGHVPQLVDKS